MKVKDLIKLLKTFNEDVNVDISDNVGNFYNIGTVEEQKWVTRSGIYHDSVTLLMSAYNSEDSVNGLVFKKSNDVDLDNVNKCTTSCSNCRCNTHNCESKDDEEKLEEKRESSEFIDYVNSSLSKNSKVDKNEAVNSKEVYDSDAKDSYLSKYDEYAKRASQILFGTEGYLNDYSLEKLLGFILKNGWINDIDKELLADKISVLKFLYNKLEEKIKAMMSESQQAKQTTNDNNIKTLTFEEFQNLFNDILHII